MRVIISLLLFLFPSAVLAQISTDGSLGQSANLPGPDYQITSDLGQQIGGNLFHSFQQFSVNTGENAVFSGPGSVQNIIGRITGGSESLIDGGLISEIPGADLFLMNPYGFAFGPNAYLNIDGAFHATTTDNIPLGENGKFSAAPGNDNLLKCPPPKVFHEAWGKAPVTVDGSALVTPEKDISLTGSVVDIKDSFINTSGSLESPGEHAGDISIRAENIEISGSALYSKSYSKGGDADIKGNNIIFSDSVLNVTGLEKTGNVNIQGNNIILDGSGIYAKSATEGGTIDITANTFEMSGINEKFGIPSEIMLTDHSEKKGTPSKFNLNAEIVSLRDGAWIFSYALGVGNGGDINITAGTIETDGESDGLGSGFYSSAQSVGNGGDITINAENMSLKNGAYINSNTYGSGDAGNINVFSDTITLSATTSIGWASSVVSGTSPREEFTTIGGNGGKIDVIAKNITLTDGGLIASSSIAQPGTEAGEAGKINITADSVTATGVNPYGPNEDGYGSGIYARSWGENAKDAGTIDINADVITLSDGGTINTESSHKGGGQITTVTGSMLYVHSGGSITTSVALGGNDGGDIDLNSGMIVLNKGSVTANAYEGDGGAIFIKTDNYLRSSDSAVTAASERGNDGTVTIDAPGTGITNSLVSLPENLPDISDFTPRECDYKFTPASSFVIKQREGQPGTVILKGFR